MCPRNFLFHDSICANVALGDPSIGEAEVRRALELAGAWELIAALPEGVWTGRARAGPGCAAASGSGWLSPGRWSAARSC